MLPEHGRLPFALLLLFILVAPLHYGGITIAGKLIIELFAFSLLTLVLMRRNGRQNLLDPVPFSASLLLLAVLGGFQLLPLPSFFLAAVSPVSLRIYKDASEILHLFDRSEIPAPKISIAPSETMGAILLILAYLSIFIVSRELVSTKRARKIFSYAIFTAAFAQILLASRELPERMGGSFLNPNHLAGYLGISLALSFGAVLGELLSGNERGPHVQDAGDRLERRAIALAAHLTLFLAIAAAIVMTRSRAGLAATVITITVLLLATAFRYRSSRLQQMFFGTSALLLLGGAIFAIRTATHGPLSRFLAYDPRDSLANFRVAAWRASILAWEEFPHFGSGLGTFRESFRRTQPAELEGLFEQAHSDPLQLLVTGGWVGAVLGILAAATVLFGLFKRWLKESRRRESSFLLGCLGACFSLLLHGLAEFNFSLPAIPATLAAVLGAAFSQVDEEGRPASSK